MSSDKKINREYLETTTPKGACDFIRNEIGQPPIHEGNQAVKHLLINIFQKLEQLEKEKQNEK